MNFEIINFEPALAKYFVQLNEEWLKKYFVIEEYDRKLFANPSKIIDDGGSIFFVKNNEGRIVGTASLLKNEDSFELSKMAVTEAFQGKGIGNILIKYCIEHAAKQGVQKIFLISNKSLTPALNMYKKFGFTEVPMDIEANPYQRGDIKMELVF